VRLWQGPHGGGGSWAERMLETIATDPHALAGKVLWVFPRRTAPRESGGLYLEYVTVEDRAGRLFVIGRQLCLSAGEWVSTEQVAIALSAIVQMVLFESRSDYVSRAQKIRPDIPKGSA
jgi:hypothetical protein